MAQWYYLKLDEEQIINIEEILKSSENNKVTTQSSTLVLVLGEEMDQDLVECASYLSPRQEEIERLGRSGDQGCLQLHSDFNVNLENRDPFSQLKWRKHLKGVIREKENEGIKGRRTDEHDLGFQFKEAGVWGPTT